MSLDPVVIAVAEARTKSVCRICGKPIVVPATAPHGWQHAFAGMTFPESLTLKYGHEFAHTACLPPET
jgi:hypothetical protein